MSDPRTLKVRTSGIRVAQGEDLKGTVWNLEGVNEVRVAWDSTDGEMHGGTYRVGADEKGEENYDLFLHAVHSYIKVTGAAMGEDGDDDARGINGVYVFANDGFIPEFKQIGGNGRISFDGDEGKWVIWSTFFGRGNYFYEIYQEVIEVPEKGWEPQGGWEEEYSPAPTLTKHELEVGQDVKLRKHHPDSHIPADKYPGPQCPFNDGDICTVDRIQGLFFAPKINPDQWIPLRAALPVSELGNEDDGDRLIKRDPKDPKASKGAKPKEGKGKAKDETAAGGGAKAIKLIKSLVEKVDNLETEVKKLQK